MRKMLKVELRYSFDFGKTFLKWVVCAIVMGLICGTVGTAFHYGVHHAETIFNTHGWLLFCLPLSGLLIVFLYQKSNMSNNKGTNSVFYSVRTSQDIPPRLAPLIFVSTILTHVCGGSAGREGAALQIGGSIGSLFGRLVQLNDKDRHLITMCGMSALFSAVFSTPITATIFCMEVISVGILHYSAFVPCLISAIIANHLAAYLGVSASTLPVPVAQVFTLPLAGKVVLLSIACALVSVLFCVLLHSSGRLYKKHLKNPYLRIVAGSALIIALTLLFGTRDYNGAGMGLIRRALNGNARPEAFFLKMILTAVTLGAGFKGGEIVPSFCIGATLGCALGSLLGIDPGFAASICMVAFFCGVVNCPMASILLSIEMFGSSNLLLFATAISVSYMLSGYYGLYSSQRIIYSKLRPNYINRMTK